jgi:dynein intermediate chain
LLLSTAADWSIGIWHPKTRKDPLIMYDGEVEVYDAQWSPVHPSVFASCNGYGQIDLWDISKDTEECRYRLDADKRAISKIRWSHDGKRLLTGNSNGTVKLWNVDKEFYQYKEEDLVKLERMLMPHHQAGLR